MPKKKYNFTSVNIPAYLVNDIDGYINSDPNLRGSSTRASFIVKVINEFLDRKASEKEKNVPEFHKSARAQRHLLTEQYDTKEDFKLPWSKKESHDKDKNIDSEIYFIQKLDALNKIIEGKKFKKL